MPSIADFATALGVILTGIGLIAASKQLRLSRSIAKQEFVLHFDDILRQPTEFEIHAALRPGGKWSAPGSGPQSVEDWIAVERYMGLFERVQVAIEDDIVNLDTVQKMYGYRVRNIVANDIIRREKLIERRAGWLDFIKLCEQLDITIEP